MDGGVFFGVNSIPWIFQSKFQFEGLGGGIYLENLDYFIK